MTPVKIGAVFTRVLSSPPIAMMCEFLNVVHQTIELPLSIHFLLAAQAEAAERCILAQVANRLQRCNATRDHVFTLARRGGQRPLAQGL